MTPTEIPASGWVVRDLPIPGNRLMGLKVSRGGSGTDRNLHTHNPGEKEIFEVLSGTATASINGTDYYLGNEEGQTSHLQITSEEHGIFNKSDDFVCIITFTKPAS